MENKKHTKKQIHILPLVCMILLLAGCVNKLNEEEISKRVKNTLQEKYDKQFTILSMYYKPMDGTFDGRYYVFECTDTEGAEPFSVRSNGAGTHIEDNYEGNLYKEDIEADIKKTLLQNKDISYTDLEIEYNLTERYFGSFEEYIKGGNTELDAVISLHTNDEHDASEIVFILVDTLQQKGYCYQLQVVWKDGYVFYAKRGRNPEDNTKQDIEKGFKIYHNTHDTVHADNKNP